MICSPIYLFVSSEETFIRYVILGCRSSNSLLFKLNSRLDTHFIIPVWSSMPVFGSSEFFGYSCISDSSGHESALGENKFKPV